MINGGKLFGCRFCSEHLFLVLLGFTRQPYQKVRSFFGYLSTFPSMVQKSSVLRKSGDANRKVMEFTVYFRWFGQPPLNFGGVLYGSQSIFIPKSVLNLMRAVAHGWRQAIFR